MKKIFFLMMLFLPMGMMAQTSQTITIVVTDPDTQLKYCTDDLEHPQDKSKWYIYLASSNNLYSAPDVKLQIGGKDANAYFAPHTNFRIYLRDQCGVSGDDGQVYWGQLQDIVKFSAHFDKNNNGSSTKAVNYKGIEYFPNLEEFEDNNSSGATSIEGDFSLNTKLKKLEIKNSTARTKITKLDISNTAITHFEHLLTGSTAGFTLIANNSSLHELNIFQSGSNSNVSILDLRGSSNLESITTNTSSTSTYLKEVYLSGTDIHTLDLSKYSNLQKVVYDKNQFASWGTATTSALRVPSGFIEIRIGNIVQLIKHNTNTELTIDVTNEDEKDVDISAVPQLIKLNVIGATSVALPTFTRTDFTLNGTGSPDLVADFGTQTTLRTLTLNNINKTDISGCSALQTLICTGNEWGDGTDGHEGLICNTGATLGSWTLPALTTINASGSSVPKLDMTNAAANLANLNICNSTMKELRVPNHTEITASSNISSATGLSLGWNSVDTKNLYGKLDGENSKWYSEGEFYYNQLEVLDVSGCSSLAGELLLSADGSHNESLLREVYASGTKITKIQIYNAPLDTIDVRNCSLLKTFWVEQCHLKTVDFSGCPMLESINAKRNFFTNGDFLTLPCEGRTAADIAKLRNIQLNGGAAASLMKDENGVERPIIRDVFTNKISHFNTQYLGSTLQTLLIADNLLQTLDIHEGMSGLRSLSCENNMLITLDLSNIDASVLTSGNWGWDMAAEQMQVAFLNVEEIKGVKEDGSDDWIALRLSNGGNSQNLDDNVKLYPSVEDALDNKNKIVAEANPHIRTIAVANADAGYEKFRPNGYTGEYLFLHSQLEIASDAGKEFADQDLYDKVLIYKYKTGFNNNEPKETIDNHIEIRAHIWPYILNINPKTRVSDLYPTGTDYYSSTICLDYDAIIPNGVTLHVPVGVQEGYKESGQPESVYTMQFHMKEVGTPGMVLPKGTPVVVKSTIAAGLYSFQTAWDFDYKGWEDYRQNIIKEAVAAERGCDPEDLYPILHGVDEENVTYKSGYDPVENSDKWINSDPQIAEYLEKNLLSGTLEDMTVDKKSILVLGMQKAPDATGYVSYKMGFWRFNGTLLPAHRCFIWPDDLKKAMDDANIAGAKDGGVFYFDDGSATDIRTIVTRPEKTEQKMYDLQGRRILGKPTPGIYIVDGKKVIVKQ